MPTTSSPSRSEIPFTPLVLRPIGRASDSLNLIAIPSAVAITNSSPPLATTALISISSSRSLIAMMPLLRGRL